MNNMVWIMVWTFGYYVNEEYGEVGCYEWNGTFHWVFDAL